MGWLLLLLGCRTPGPVVDAGGPILDIHTHCPTESPTCDVTPLEQARGGQVTAGVLGLTHYAIAESLGDEVPAEFAPLMANNQAVLDVSSSEHVLLMPSLECLMDTPGSDPGFTAACLADADRWIALGAVGFKDHAGKTYEGSEVDLARWVGAYNRFAGWCVVDDTESAPNQACVTQSTMRFPLAVDAYREVVRGVVEDREKVWLTHAVPWYGSEDVCGSAQGPQRCHDVAVAVRARPWVCLAWRPGAALRPAPGACR